MIKWAEIATEPPALGVKVSGVGFATGTLILNLEFATVVVIKLIPKIGDVPVALPTTEFPISTTPEPLSRPITN